MWNRKSSDQSEVTAMYNGSCPFSSYPPSYQFAESNDDGFDDCQAKRSGMEETVEGSDRREDKLPA